MTESRLPSGYDKKPLCLFIHWNVSSLGWGLERCSTRYLFSRIVESSQESPSSSCVVEIHWAMVTAGGGKGREEASPLPYEEYRGAWAPLARMDTQSNVVCDGEASHHS